MNGQHQSTMNGNHRSTKVNFFNSIQSRIIFSTLAISLIPLIVMAVIAYTVAQESLRTSINNQYDSLTASKAVQVDQWLDNLTEMAESTAGMPGLAGDGTGLAGIEALSGYLNDVDAAALYDSAYNNAHQIVKSLADHHHNVDAAFVSNPDGVFNIVPQSIQGIIQEGSNAQNFDSTREAFRQGLNGSYISDVIISGDGRTPIMIVSEPIIGSDGSTVGVLYLRVKMTDLGEIMRDVTGLGETGETYMVNTNTGLMLTESRFTEEGGESTILNQAVDTFAMQQVRAGVSEGHAVYEDYRGVPVVGAWRDLSSGNNNQHQWTLLAEINQAEAHAPVQSLANASIVVTVIASLGIVFLAYFVARSIYRPIAKIADVAVRIADGDLEERVDITSRNEIGILAQSFNAMTDNLRNRFDNERDNRNRIEGTVSGYMQFIDHVAQGDLTNRLDINGNFNENDEELRTLGINLNYMVENLAEMAGQIREAASNISASASEIEAATTQQTASATEQDAAVTQTVATLEEVRTTVAQTADRAQNVSEASQQSARVSRDGEEAVNETIEGMHDIRDQVSSIAETILMLSDQTGQIGEIIDTVNGLAEQSQLLALNASIEAARAGAEGKGFAVVAMEVRQLAEQSRDATARVRDILGEIQQATNTAVKVTEEGSRGTETGMERAQRAGDSIRELASTIDEAARASAQIAASTHQQINGMDQLSSAMTQIKQAATQTSASARQVETSVRDLTEMARHLEDIASRYRVALGVK